MVYTHHTNSSVVHRRTREATGGTNWNEVAKRYETSRVGTGQVKASTYEREERRRIERTIELICAKGRGAANGGQGVMRNYTSKYLGE